MLHPVFHRHTTRLDAPTRSILSDAVGRPSRGPAYLTLTHLNRCPGMMDAPGVISHTKLIRWRPWLCRSRTPQRQRTAGVFAAHEAEWRHSPLGQRRRHGRAKRAATDT